MKTLQETCNDIAYENIEIGDKLECLTSDFLWTKQGQIVKIDGKNDADQKIFYNGTWISTRILTLAKGSKIPNKFAQFWKNLGQNQE